MNVKMFTEVSTGVISGLIYHNLAKCLRPVKPSWEIDDRTMKKAVHKLNPNCIIVSVLG
jgi:hypothetical protein